MPHRSLVALVLAWLIAPSAAAQTAPLRTWSEPGARYEPAPPPPVGACLGGDCARQRGPERPPPPRPRGELAYAGAIFGTASAGLVLAGAIAIAVADDPPSERVTRGLWVGYLTVSTPLVALSAYLGRRGTRAPSYARVRRLGWGAYSAAVVNGVLLWSGTFYDYTAPKALTIAAGATGVLALLPHALDALIAARAVRSRRFLVLPTPAGLAVRF